MIKEYGTITKELRLSAATLLALGTLGLGAISASAANQQVPLKATFAGSAQRTSQTTVAFSGTGNATQMGRITTDGHVDITGSDSSCQGGVANVNVETLTGANGDKLTISSQDVACPTGPGQYHGTGKWTVTGGTGKFSDATGQGSFDGHSDFNAGTFTTTLTGALDLGAHGD
jgi:hypothetical protein